MDLTEADDITVSIWRGAADGAFRDYHVVARANETVLDLVTQVQRRLDPTLAYRFACRVGMCGSCAMTVSGKPRWTCRTLVSDVARGGRLRLAPLENLPVIRDLVADMSAFFDKWQRARGRFRPTDAEGDFALIKPESEARRRVDAAIECINCGVCYAACEVVGRLPDYLGPAALNRAWSLQNDERDGGFDDRLAAVAGAGGCLDCHTGQRCTAFCPKTLNPTRAIAGLKRMTATALLKGRL
ncbi:MAG: 2Fe-2S iron-sulfur cluster-binding protein [Alphaproteobacteria bacterium]|nr:2Fe-2S iron-sulfur cluster-binding protein [Alphaproteobacteria bacterium]